jgi:DNA-binding response OmpR family regulator
MSETETIQRIMIIDDDSHVRIAVRTILDEAGYEIISADSGRSGIEHLKNGFSGLILLDIMMPEMDGWDVIQKILDEDLYHNIVIVMLTAKGIPDSKMIGLQEWVLDYLTKPFDPEYLIEKTAYYMKLLHDTRQSSP